MSTELSESRLNEMRERSENTLYENESNESAGDVRDLMAEVARLRGVMRDALREMSGDDLDRISRSVTGEDHPGDVWLIETIQQMAAVLRRIAAAHG